MDTFGAYHGLRLKNVAALICGPCEPPMDSEISPESFSLITALELFPPFSFSLRAEKRPRVHAKSSEYV